MAVKRYGAYDPDTGETIEDHFFVDINAGDRVLKKKQVEYCQKKERRYEDKTDFVWLFFKYGTPVLSDVTNANLVRLVYIGTFCGEDGIINHNKMIHAKFFLNKNQQTAFRREIYGKGFLREGDGATYIDTKIILRGTIQPNGDYIRLFTGFYRSLYEIASTQIAQNRLYYILQMIPFLNRQTNIISYNRKEQDSAAVENMSFNTYCEKLGFNKSHSSQLRKSLLSFRVNGELAVGFFNDPSMLTQDGKYVMINPKLCFGGERARSSYKDACALFQAESERWASMSSTPC